MIHRYFSLSDNAKLDQSKSIWIVDRSWVMVPNTQLSLLFDYYHSFEIENSEFLNENFNTFESLYIEIDNEGEVVINLPLQIKKKCLFLFNRLQTLIKSEKLSLIDLYLEKYEVVYENSEYVHMLQALIDIIQEAIRLNENLETWLDH